MSDPAASYPKGAVVHPKLQNILFTTDFSPCADAALPYARALAERYNSTVHVLHVVGLEPVTGEFSVHFGDLLEKEIDAARCKLNELTRSDKFRGLLYTQTIQRGAVWEVVSRVVRNLQIDLIVLATHGRSGLKQLVLGSVAEQIFRSVSCPVLTIGPECKDGMAEGKLAAVLCATDFSPASLRAFEYALFFAQTNKAKLFLLHAISGNEAMLAKLDAEFRKAKRLLADLVSQAPDIDCEAAVVSGAAAEAILRLAGDAKADLIVMGAHRGALVAAHSPWAVAHKVVCHAHCPVLTVRT